MKKKFIVMLTVLILPVLVYAAGLMILHSCKSDRELQVRPFVRCFVQELADISNDTSTQIYTSQYNARLVIDDSLKSSNIDVSVGGDPVGRIRVTPKTTPAEVAKMRSAISAYDGSLGYLYMTEETKEVDLTPDECTFVMQSCKDGGLLWPRMLREKEKTRRMNELRDRRDKEEQLKAEKDLDRMFPCTSVTMAKSPVDTAAMYSGKMSTELERFARSYKESTKTSLVSEDGKIFVDGNERKSHYKEK